MAELRQIGIDLDVHRVIEEQRRSFSESENDILRRMLLIGRGREETVPPIARQAPPASSEPDEPRRVRGNWALDYQGERIPAANLKDAYRLLLRLAQGFPNFLEEFSRIGSRSRRFVAQTPHELYAQSPHLTAHHARILTDGWFYDTNLSTDQINQRSRIAARICGLHYGSEIAILSNVEEAA